MELPNFIELYDNVFSKEYCDKVISEYNYAEKIGIAKPRHLADDINTKRIHKQDSSFFMSSQYKVINDIEGLATYHTDETVIQEFSNVFWNVAYAQYATKYDILKTAMDLHNVYSMKIQKTEPGEGYHVWHCENASRITNSRLLSWIVYLNDDFEAGETEFLYQQLRCKPKQGSVIIFPACFTHVHRGNPPIKGTKYILTGWVEF
jgi:hypothetical protein